MEETAERTVVVSVAEGLWGFERSGAGLKWSI